MIRDVNIMVFPSGTEVGLEIHRSLKNIRFITLYGGDTFPGHGEYVYKNHYGALPKITDDNFIDEFQKLLLKHKIDLVFPTIEDALVKLSENRSAFKAKILTPCDETVKICRDKSKTYQKLGGAHYLPQIYKNAESVDEYPVIIKPACGQGSIGFNIIHNRKQLEEHLSEGVKNVICEYLPGREYTVDCFTNNKGELLYISARDRTRIKGGICVTSTMEKINDDVEKIAKDINEKLNMEGEWFFQIKEDRNQKLKLMEVATRCAGTMCVNRAVNVNLPLLTVLDAIGEKTTIEQLELDVRVDRSLYNCYRTNLSFDELYLDYDDTLIIHDRINHEAIRLIYQCIENNIPVFLLTRHKGDIHSELSKRHIASTMFKEIIHVPINEQKIRYVSPSTSALFIDDSFNERRAMHEKYGINVLGPDCIETLIDWRM